MILHTDGSYYNLDLATNFSFETKTYCSCDLEYEYGLWFNCSFPELDVNIKLLQLCGDNEEELINKIIYAICDFNTALGDKDVFLDFDNILR